MAVDKGVDDQRFICTFGPLNYYMRPLGGDAATLPQAIFLSKFILGPGEILSIDGEDFQSCFNLFRLPAVWRGFMAFCKKVPNAIFDIPGDGETYACVTIVPMGWSASVDLIQNCLRKFSREFHYREI